MAILLLVMFSGVTYDPISRPDVMGHTIGSRTTHSSCFCCLPNLFKWVSTKFGVDGVPNGSSTTDDAIFNIGASFFMTYVMTSGWSGLSFELLQPVGLIRNWLFKCVLMKEEDFVRPVTFSYHTEDDFEVYEFWLLHLFSPLVEYLHVFRLYWCKLGGQFWFLVGFNQMGHCILVGQCILMLDIEYFLHLFGIPQHGCLVGAAILVAAFFRVIQLLFG
ncbi:CSC1-like protein RXW8 [Tanacetum coccineum]